MRRSLLVVCMLGAFACDKEKTATITGPGLIATPPSASTAEAASGASGSATPSATASDPGPPMNGPPSALFAEVTAAKPLPMRVTDCDEVVVTFVRGKGSALGETLATNDVLLAKGEGKFDVKGDGTVVVGRVMPKQCTPSTTVTKQIVRASAAKDLAWAGGAMHARLDVEGDASPNVYVGHLEGTAPVAEHTHPGTWEIICASEGSGIFTLGGQRKRLGPREVVVVPPGTPHSWKPDPNAKLVAVQMYAPPGPEQRFKKLAAESTDAGK